MKKRYPDQQELTDEQIRIVAESSKIET